MTYDPDRFDAEILLDRMGYGVYTLKTVPKILGISYDCVRKRLDRGVYPRPAIEDAAGTGFIPCEGGSRPLRHEWSKEQVIDMMLAHIPDRRLILKPLVHGTVSGYYVHRNRKILPICDACREAGNAARRKRKDNRKVAA